LFRNRQEFAVKIIVLPDSWASRIAAGEVVERPSSVVKELVENSLDAGAKEISIWIEGSGASLIRVSDDGEGMAGEDLVLSVERHATSKLKEEADLFRIATLGFRGEALPSIASVSKLKMTSRTRGESVGCRVSVEGGVKQEPTEVGCPVGTTVEVRELFFNTPARRKFLRSPPTELGHICDVINRTALAFPAVHLRLYHAGKTLCDYPGTPRMEDRLRQVLGAEVSVDMASFSSRHGNVDVTGFLSVAPASFPNTRYLMTYVNHRFVRDRILTHAVLEGYETLLMKGRYPATVLHVSVPFGEVDVNVHPAKYEVRFRRQTEMHDLIVAAVRTGLRERARKAMATSLNFNTAAPWATMGVHESPQSYRSFNKGEQAEIEAPPAQFPETQHQEKQSGAFASLEVLGQLLGCYLVCSSANGLVLIDQHAAHERVAFEKLRDELNEGSLEHQSLLLPQIIELPFAESTRVESMLELLDQIGFTIEPFGTNCFALKAIPSVMPPGDYREAVRRMAAEAAEIEKGGELRRGLEERLMTIACHSVIRANRRLARDEMRALLTALDEVEFATQCPHGRPVMVEFSRSHLDRLFKRV
jgi:DNA mismatch repair protein MutL